MTSSWATGLFLLDCFDMPRLAMDNSPNLLRRNAKTLGNRDLRLSICIQLTDVLYVFEGELGVVVVLGRALPQSPGSMQMISTAGHPFKVPCRVIALFTVNMVYLRPTWRRGQKCLCNQSMDKAMVNAARNTQSDLEVTAGALARPKHMSFSDPSLSPALARKDHLSVDGSNVAMRAHFIAREARYRSPLNRFDHDCPLRLMT
ncbi:hypothetical protein QK396_30260 [Pseudomonas aeruginosa]|nr:hypothetical protein [Pseudomonas aeruginosa]